MTINICNPPIGYVEIGRMGENLYRELNIDVSAWLAELPGASVSVVFRRPDGQVYPVIVNSSEQVIAWLPNSSDLAVPGTGMLEVRLYLDDAICKSAIINTATSRALGALWCLRRPLRRIGSPQPAMTLNVQRRRQTAQRAPLCISR